MKTFSNFLLLMMLGLVFTTCGKKDVDPAEPVPEKAQLEIVLTDAPSNYAAINVNLIGLEYNVSADSTIGTGWQPLSLSNAGVVNLLALRNGTGSTLTNATITPIGIKQLRLRFGSTGNSVTFNGTVYPLVIPADILAKGAIIKAEYAVVANQSLSIWLDFDAAASVLRDSSSNIFTLQPRITTFDPSQSGAILGWVAPAASEAIVIIQSDSSNSFPSSTRILFPSYDKDGFFKAAGLSPGDYTVTVKPGSAKYRSKTFRGLKLYKNHTFSISKITLEELSYDHASQFVGNWKIFESVSKNIGGFVGTDSFNASTILQNDSTFGIVQTFRTPDPEWVLSAPYFNADTLWFIPLQANRVLKNTYQGNIGNYSLNRDTLQFTYTFGAPGNYFVYLVTQKWIKR